MSKKGLVTLYFVFFVIAVIIVIMAAVLAPLGVRLSSEFYLAGEDIMLSAEPSISAINDTAVRNSVYAVWNESKNAHTTNIEVLTDIFQYGWVIVLVLAAVVLFLFSRQLVEYGGGLV